MPTLRPALVTFATLAVLTGLAYPLTLVGAGRLCFRQKAEGSLLRQNEQLVGSRLIAQHTEDPKYFWGRLSATGDFPTNAANSGGSNLAPSNPNLIKAADRRLRALRAADPGNEGPVPVDLLTASGSGLDPHISPAAAAFQVARVARMRSLPIARVQDLVARHSKGRLLGILGEPRVHVLELNMALDEQR